MKGLKVNPCVGCANNCLRVDLLCRPDHSLQCWRNQFEARNFAAFLLRAGGYLA